VEIALPRWSEWATVFPMRPYFPAMIVIAAVASAQDATTPQSPVWVRSTKNDPLHGTSFDVFTLDGKYLTPPSKTDGTPPKIVLRCSGGELSDGYIIVGAVVDRGAKGTSVEMRLDGKLSKEFWDVGTDGLAVFMNPRIDLLKILWGTWLPHKDGKGDFVRQEIIGVPEAFASTIVMQFDMPQDQAAVLDTCTFTRNGKRFSRRPFR
jgi:hypothetical protein